MKIVDIDNTICYYDDNQEHNYLKANHIEIVFLKLINYMKTEMK